MEEADGPAVRLPARATRGKRLTKLIEDEDEADQAFWSQDAFNEEDQEEYVSEEEEQDVFDSDFDDDEDLEDDGEEDVDDRPKRKRKAPPGAAPKQPPRKASAGSRSVPTTGGQAKSFEAVFQDRIDGAKATKGTPKPKRPKPEQEAVLWGEGGVERRSKRAVVVERNVEREQEERQRVRSRKTVTKKKPVVEERRLTQEEMLAEAAQTEIANLQSLEIMLAREEEIKRRAVIHKEAFAGPQIRYHSKGGLTVLEFTRVETLPAVINSKAPPYPPRSLCAITGLPAKYKDPLTGLPYATLEAFKTLRERWTDRRKRPRPASTGDHPPGRRAKLDAAENVKLIGSAPGLRRGGQKGARDSPGPSTRGRSLRRNSPREGQSPGPASSEERSPGPASPAELPPSRFALQGGMTEPPIVQISGPEKPLPSLQDVTLEDFDVGRDVPATEAEPLQNVAGVQAESEGQGAGEVDTGVQSGQPLEAGGVDPSSGAKERAEPTTAADGCIGGREGDAKPEPESGNVVDESGSDPANSSGGGGLTEAVGRLKSQIEQTLKQVDAEENMPSSTLGFPPSRQSS